MKKETLENKIRFLYKYREGSHTSFSIALEAGANNENEEIYTKRVIFVKKIKKSIQTWKHGNP